nr:MAG TPA: hypothetical protein [Caudoviricetes sp.]
MGRLRGISGLRSRPFGLNTGELGCFGLAKKKKTEDSKHSFDPQEARLRLLETTLVSIEYADAGQRASLVREARALITDIAGVQKPRVEAESVAEGGDAVVNFQERLAKQRSSSSAPRRRRSSG